MKLKTTCEHCSKPVRVDGVTLTLQGAVIDYRHEHGDYYCILSNLADDYSAPQCHICSTTPGKPHGQFCSAAGDPHHSPGATLLRQPGDYADYEG